MVDIQVMGRPQSRIEIGRVLEAKLAIKGKTKADFAVKECHIAPYVLNSLLKGGTKIETHPIPVRLINTVTGADMKAWEK